MENLIKLAKSKIPTIKFIFEKAWNKLEIEKCIVSDKFGQILISTDLEATRIFKEYERQALFELAKGWLDSQQESIKERLEIILSQKEWETFVSEAAQLFTEFGILIQNFEKSLGNMRKSRGGRTFELSILKLLRLIGIDAEFPSGVARERLRRIDIVIPSNKIALETPDRAIFLTCKRTLRERWKQEIPQVRANQRVYLLTIDEELSKTKAEEINEKSLIAFVRDEIKETEYIRDMPWIRKLSELPKELQRL